MAKKKKTASARTMPMRILDDEGIPYKVRQQSKKQLTASGVAEDLGVPLNWVVKAMILQCSDGAYVLALIPGDKQLSLKKIGAALGDKNVSTAEPRDVQRVTGYQVGAVSVLGFRRQDVETYVDRGVESLEQAIISSGRPDMGLALSGSDLLEALQGAAVGDFTQ